MDKYGTQWAAQFYVAAELTRRNYLVSFTMGNAKRTDLHVTSPGGVKFSVQVKGAQTQIGWWAREDASTSEHFYILVYIERSKEEPGPNVSKLLVPRFFVLTNEETQKLIENGREVYLRKHPGTTREEASRWDGPGWKDAFPSEDRWDKLPQ